MSFKDFLRAKKLKIMVPVMFASLILGGAAGAGVRIGMDKHTEKLFNDYETTLRASGEVGNIEHRCVLPFGDRQIVLTMDYTNAVKKELEPAEYPLLVKAFTEPIQEINDLKIGYNFTVCSEDGSFGLPMPSSNMATVNWDLLEGEKSNVIGEWTYDSDMFHETYSYYQSANTISAVSLPIGMETFFGSKELQDVDKVTVYGQEYSTARLLYTYKIVKHEIEHSIGVGHVDKKKDNVPKTRAGILETYMTPSINMFYIGDSQYDTNTMISAVCVRKILDGTQNKDDKNFDSSHFDTFNEFLQKGKENLANQQGQGLE